VESIEVGSIINAIITCYVFGV
ncbi:hypothetical protein CCACVL1_03261, partial [Corchorus capsularis]